MKLLVKDLRNKSKPLEEVEFISRDGWVISRNRGFGDNGKDCKLFVELNLKEIRKKANLTQLEMARIMGITRVSYINRENGKFQINLVEYLALTKSKELFKLIKNL